MTRSYQIRTYGCQMNVHDSERLAGLLEDAGYVRAGESDAADLVVFNTCAVRENADNRPLRHARHLYPAKAANPDMQIAVGGCLAQKDRGRIVEKARVVDVVFGTHNLAALPVLLERARHNNEAQVEIVVLQALATGPVDYYGDSYGTFFGQVFATRHPDLVRTIVLDSAYPVIGGTPYFATEIENGPVALERVCARSPACASLPTSVTQRFQALLASLRANPVVGMAPGINGALRHVKADAGALFLVIYNVGNNLVAYRDLDAAGRAYLENGDALPLLRLVGEAEAGNASGGSAAAFSNGLSDAVLCSDYHQLFDMRAPFGGRRDQLVRSLAAKQANDPDVYAPFTLAEAVGAPQDPESLDTCTEWPAAPDWVHPGEPVPAGTAFPKVPVLVLSGELDTVTSPKEGSQTTALFPEAWFVVVRNAGHETAIGDGGVYIPPFGSDLTRCVGPIVLNFVATGGDPGDTSCALHGRPIRTVPGFARHWRDVPPADALPGNAADPEQLSLASAAAETIGDALARYYVTLSGTDLGLRGGPFPPVSDQPRLHAASGSSALDAGSFGDRHARLGPA